MTTIEPPTPGSLDHYRAMAESDPNIAALVGMIDRIKAQLRTALEELTRTKKED